MYWFTLFTYREDTTNETAAEPEREKEGKAEEQNQEDTPAQSVGEQWNAAGYEMADLLRDRLHVCCAK